jgi:hypothetical protein
VLRNAGVDTNVFNDESSEVADETIVLSPTLDALLPVGRRLRLKGHGGLGFNYFRQASSERSTDRFGSGELELDVGPLTLFFGGGGGRYRQRFSIEIDQRLARRESHVHAGTTLRLGRKLTTTFKGERRVSSYEAGVLVQGDDVKTSLDRRTLVGSALLGYAATKQTTFVLQAEVQEDEFLSELPDVPNTALSYRYLGGFSFAPTAFVNGDVQAGVRHFPSRGSQAAPAYTGSTLAVNASVPFFRFGRLGGVAMRDIHYAVTQARTQEGTLRNSYVSGRYGGSLNLELPLSLIARATLDYERARYLLPYEREQGLFEERVDRVRTYGVALLRAFGSSLRVGGSVEWQRRESNFSGFGYERLAYGVTAELAP